MNSLFLGHVVTPEEIADSLTGLTDIELRRFAAALVKALHNEGERYAEAFTESVVGMVGKMEKQ